MKAVGYGWGVEGEIQFLESEGGMCQYERGKRECEEICIINVVSLCAIISA